MNVRTPLVTWDFPCFAVLPWLPGVSPLVCCTPLITWSPPSSLAVLPWLPGVPPPRLLHSLDYLGSPPPHLLLFIQVSVMHSVMSGYTDKALSYADKAFQFMNVSPKSGELHLFYDFATSSPGMSCKSFWHPLKCWIFFREGRPETLLLHVLFYALAFREFQN